MIPFLKETAADILSKFGQSSDKIFLIFPNKRTRIFFTKYFAELYGKVHWTIKTDTLKNLIKNTGNLAEPDKLTLIFELYQVYKDLSKTQKIESVQNFASFYKLGEIILSDFNEIDNWLANPERIYQNIADIHEIDSGFDWLTDEQKDVLRKFWVNFSPEKQSNEQQKFLHIRAVLPVMYAEFNKKLRRKKLAYNGLIYRDFVEHINEFNFNKSKFEHYIFVGFNALNKAEEAIFKYFKSINKAVFYWDTDAYYHYDVKQEAGDFLRKNFRELKIKDYPVPNNFLENPKEIELIGMPLQVGQAKLTASLLQNLTASEAPEETAIVLADEHLLFPTLYSLPPEYEQINVTMGYPMKSTSVYSLIELYVNLHRNALRKPTGEYYYKDVTALLQHPAVKEQEKDTVESIIEHISENKRVYLKAGSLTEHEGLILKLLFKKMPEKNTEFVLLENLLNILFLIFDKRKDENEKNILTVENEYIHKAYTHIKRFRDVIFNNDIELGFKLFADLLLQSLSGEQVPFTGKAQKGIQLMGVLETRNLDYKNVIILGLNEGNFPALNRSASFITENMRYVFGLPLIRHKDAVFAYLFYRLLQRAEHITLVYNNIVNDKNSGEISRFVKQLQAETGFTIIEKQYSQMIEPSKPAEIYVQKTADIQKKLNRYTVQNGYCARRFSASALNTYIDCSLQFYFRYIAGFRAEQDIEEDVTHAALGTVLHKTLENLYKYLHRQKASGVIEKSDFKILNNLVPEYVENAFRDYYEADNESDFVFEGNQIIIKEVIENYARKVLRTDERYVPFEILFLEDENAFMSEIEFKFEDKIRHAGITGTIDRVDKKDDIVRVVDYKTGKVDKDFTDFEALFSSEKKMRNKNVMQLFLYGLLYKDKLAPIHVLVEPAVYDVRSMYNASFSSKINLKVGRDRQAVNPEVFETLLPDYKRNLSKIIEEIFNSEKGFEQTDNLDVCKWCDYKNICKR